MAESAVPILASSDLVATSAFYAAFGFDEVKLFPEQYLIIQRGDVHLHFWCAGASWDPATNSSGCYLYVDDAETWHAQARTAGVPTGARGFPRTHAPGDTDYGLREAAIVDPDGNLLRIGSAMADPPGPQSG